MVPPRIALATGNADKAAEWRGLLGRFGVELVPRPDITEPDESGLTVTENAWIKALAVARNLGLPALGDDVGLELDALDGAPGVQLRRWAKQLGGWEAARDEAAGMSGSRGVYRCGIALAWPDGSGHRAVGSVPGRLVAPVGPGFGMEPCFVADNCEVALSMLDPESRRVKHPRGRALADLFFRLQ